MENLGSNVEGWLKGVTGNTRRGFRRVLASMLADDTPGKATASMLSSLNVHFADPEDAQPMRYTASGTTKLAAAMLDRAILDFLLEVQHPEEFLPQYSSRAWLFGEELAGGGLTFTQICAMLHVEVEYVRKLILSLVEVGIPLGDGGRRRRGMPMVRYG